MINYLAEAFKALEDIEDKEFLESIKGFKINTKDSKKIKTLKESIDTDKKLNEGYQEENDFYVVSDGKNPRNSTVFSNLGRFDAIDYAKDYIGGYWEVLHVKPNGTQEVIWSTDMADNRPELTDEDKAYIKKMVDEADIKLGKKYCEKGLGGNAYFIPLDFDVENNNLHCMRKMNYKDEEEEFKNHALDNFCGMIISGDLQLCEDASLKEIYIEPKIKETDGLVYIPVDEIGRRARDFDADTLKEHGGIVKVEDEMTLDFEECWPELAVGERYPQVNNHEIEEFEGKKYLVVPCVLINYKGQEELKEDSIKLDMTKHAQSDPLGEKEYLSDKVTKVLDDYGILYGEVIENSNGTVNIVGVDEDEWQEVVDAISAELGLDVLVPDEDHDELDNELIVRESLKESVEEAIDEGAEGKRVPGKEYVIYDASKDGKAPIVAIRKTYTEAQWYCNKPENFEKELGIEEVPAGKFHKGDDFWGPFDANWEKLDETKENKKYKRIRKSIPKATDPVANMKALNMALGNTEPSGTAVGENLEEDAKTERKSGKKLRRKEAKMNESVYSLLDEQDIIKAKEDVKESEEHPVEKIVDVDANTINDLKDSYVGNAILQCPVCRTLIYKKPDALKSEEDNPEIYNKEEACPHCGSLDGFELVGQVAKLTVEEEEPISSTGKEEVETTVEDNVEVEEKPEENINKAELPELTTEEDIKVESLFIKKFDDKLNNILVEKFSNIKKYESTNCVAKDAKSILVEGTIYYTSGKKENINFNFSTSVNLLESLNNTVEYIGACDKFAKIGTFVLTNKVDSTEVCLESLFLK